MWNYYYIVMKVCYDEITKQLFCDYAGLQEIYTGCLLVKINNYKNTSHISNYQTFKLVDFGMKFCVLNEKYGTSNIKQNLNHLKKCTRMLKLHVKIVKIGASW